ncbi:MAG TPA: SDR family oxidoreductase [Bacteriovoracaceae bacterium]|nr:SDR family oxidoreductase [Bacteriovoracaceae bacterium]
MSFISKPIHQQVFFITGATSGIGLATVRMAVGQGAKVFMVARNENDLQKIQDEMRTIFFETAYAVADVAEFDQVQSAADNCIRTFGRIDTWVNNAGITIYSKLLDTTEEEAKRLFDTNFWGMVNGCKIAVPLMREKGGTIINMGSILAKTADPLQGIYTASEHAIRGFTDALRKELISEKAPISLTLLIPGSVDTPFLEHARTNTTAASVVTPVSTPEEVASVVLKCAVKPAKESRVGSASYFWPFARRVRVPRSPGSLFSVPEKEGQVRGIQRVPDEVNRHSSLAAGALAIVGGTLVLFRKFKII